MVCKDDSGLVAGLLDIRHANHSVIVVEELLHSAGVLSPAQRRENSYSADKKYS